MDLLLNVLKSIIFGIVQGITEWLPISSTGHLILLEQYMPLNVFGADMASNTAFWDMYKVVIQFGSIIAVLLLYWKSLWPLTKDITPCWMRLSSQFRTTLRPLATNSPVSAPPIWLRKRSRHWN